MKRKFLDFTAYKKKLTKQMQINQVQIEEDDEENEIKKKKQGNRRK